MCRYIYLSSPLVVAALSSGMARLAGGEDQHSPSPHSVGRGPSSKAICPEITVP